MDGLYQYRYYIYAGGFLVPSLMARLAFINPGPAYLSREQSARCRYVPSGIDWR
jgi:hypothetical protein